MASTLLHHSFQHIVVSRADKWCLKDCLWADLHKERPSLLPPGCNHYCTHHRKCYSSSTVENRANIIKPRKGLTSPSSPALQPVSLFATAEAVDKGAKLFHVTDMLRDNHLLLDYVGLRQVCPFLKLHFSTN